MVCAVSVGDNCTCSIVRQPSSGAHPSSSTSMPQGTTFAIPVQLHCTTSTPAPMNSIVMESSKDSNMWLLFFIATAKVIIFLNLFCFLLKNLKLFNFTLLLLQSLKQNARREVEAEIISSASRSFSYQSNSSNGFL